MESLVILQKYFFSALEMYLFGEEGKATSIVKIRDASHN